jgi:asparagine synthase (glutamine-hydrolysing)
MCGIVGIWSFETGLLSSESSLCPSAEEQLGRLRRATKLLAHRGPDDEGYLTRAGAAFGHRRLSIIDLAGSPQPMSSADGLLHITFNGEILNYLELRRELRSSLRTSGDTETILALHAEHGLSAVNRLEGQFAYALLDERTSELLLVRDRLGILPLYYVITASELFFASEVKALLALLPGRPAVDTSSLDAYLTGRSVPAPYTLFEGIRKLPAGHLLRVTREGAHEPESYWQLPPVAQATRPLAPDDAVIALREALQSAVTRNLVADVPVGAYLSGGVDSSLIVAMASRSGMSGGIETFAAGFGDPRYDDLRYAREVSELLGTSHHEVHVTAQDFEALWPKLTWHRDAPISDASDVAVYRLAVVTRQHVKAVLSGEGSDELFGGYPKARFAGLTEWIGLVPAPIRTNGLTWLERALPARGSRARIAVRALSGQDSTDRMLTWFAAFTKRERTQLLNGRAGRHSSYPCQVVDSDRDPLRHMLALDTLGWLPDNLLERADRMSMAASLEMRPPFLDRAVVELAFSMPSEVKVRGGRTKWVVKEVARDFLPDHIVDRRKVGFRVPLDNWFRAGLRDFAADTLLDRASFTNQVFDPRAVRRLVESHLSGRRDEELRLWTLLCLEVWHDVFFRHPLPT